MKVESKPKSKGIIVRKRLNSDDKFDKKDYIERMEE